MSGSWSATGRIFLGRDVGVVAGALQLIDGAVELGSDDVAALDPEGSAQKGPCRDPYPLPRLSCFRRADPLASCRRRVSCGASCREPRRSAQRFHRRNASPSFTSRGHGGGVNFSIRKSDEGRHLGREMPAVRIGRRGWPRPPRPRRRRAAGTSAPSRIAWAEREPGEPHDADALQGKLHLRLALGDARPGRARRSRRSGRRP